MMRGARVEFLRLGCLILPIAAGALIGHAATAADPQPVFPPAPRLAITAAELAARKSAPDFAAVRQAALAVADPLVATPIPLPDGFGSWVFYYACPDDGRDLVMISLTEHECPQCKKRYTDERTVTAYRCLMHYAAERAAESLGWAFAYTGDEKYAAGVRRILIKLADDYHTYPARLDRWGRRGILAPLGGRRFVQSLDEAVGVIALAKGYDLTRDAQVWTDADRKHVEQDLFRATADTLLVFNQDINNHQTWYNAGLMAIGSVLADADLVQKTLNMRGGFYDQLKRSFGDDGIWYEGTMAYQNYALQALVHIVDTGRRLGLPLHEDPKFKILLAGPLKVAYPNGQYACINDSDPSGFQIFQWSYEWAWNTYHDPRFAQAAAWGNPDKLKTLLGPDAKPEWPLDSQSEKLAEAGLAILRVGAGPEATCAFFDYGQHGGGHGHYDKLNITLFANGREWLFDTGRIGYTFKEYKTWVKQTVAHNTVVLNGRDQAPSTGELLWLKTGDGFAGCAGESKGAYPGSTLRRWLLLTGKMLVDVYDVESPSTKQIDWLAHAVTEPVVPVGGETLVSAAKIGDSNGYQHLSDVQRWQQDHLIWDFPANAKPDSPRLRLFLALEPKEERYTAIGIGVNTSQKAPCLVRRRQAASTRFVTVYDLSGQGQYVKQVQNLEGKLPRVRVETTDGAWNVDFAADGVKVAR